LDSNAHNFRADREALGQANPVDGLTDRMSLPLRWRSVLIICL